MTSLFLTARWEHLILLNYVVPTDVLAPFVPRGTELDSWQGCALASVVGFLFADTRLLGVPVPAHRTFEEVNLRFYVRRQMDGKAPRRGVVFIRELVPREAIAALARWTYNEPYIAVPMQHAIEVDPEQGGAIQYAWGFGGHRYALSATVQGPPEAVAQESEAEFITEHYWGYTRQRDGSTLEYEVQHPRWRVWNPVDFSFSGPAAPLYGVPFGPLLNSPPRSAFVAEGSAVSVRAGAHIA